MKAFWQILKRYVAPYKGYVGGSVVLNILSAVFNVFSFSLLIPILQILFNVDETHYEFIPWYRGMDFKEISNNAYYYVAQFIEQYGQSHVLLICSASSSSRSCSSRWPAISALPP